MHHTLEQLNFTQLMNPWHWHIWLSLHIPSLDYNTDIINIMKVSKEMYISSTKHDMGSKEMSLN